MFLKYVVTEITNLHCKVIGCFIVRRPALFGMRDSIHVDCSRVLDADTTSKLVYSVEFHTHSRLFKHTFFPLFRHLDCLVTFIVTSRRLHLLFLLQEDNGKQHGKNMNHRLNLHMYL